jgi:ATP-binding cassette, subfamily B, bacterial
VWFLHRHGSEMMQVFPGTFIKMALRKLQKIIGLIWQSSPALMILMVTLSLLESLLPDAGAYSAKLLIDSILSEINSAQPSLQGILPAMIFTVTIAISSLILSSGRQTVQALLGNLLTNHISQMVISHAATLDLSFYENPEYHDLLQRAQNESGYCPLDIINQFSNNGYVILKAQFGV